MQEKYDQVPAIITNKDLDYLSDMFQWNYQALKSSKNNQEEIKDLAINNLFEKASNFFLTNLNTILKILSDGGTNE